MHAVARAEAADLAEDGGAVPSAGLEGVESAREVPGHPEADQLGILDGGGCDVVPDELVVVLDAGCRGGEGLGEHGLVEVEVVGVPAGASVPPALHAVALVAPEIGVFGHGD